MSTESEQFRDDAGEQEDVSRFAQGGQSGQVDPAEGADFGDDLDDEDPAAGGGGSSELADGGSSGQVDPAEGADVDQ